MSLIHTKDKPKQKTAVRAWAPHLHEATDCNVVRLCRAWMLFLVGARIEGDSWEHRLHL